jgi:hypothetical protein
MSKHLQGKKRRFREDFPKEAPGLSHKGKQKLVEERQELPSQRETACTERRQIRTRKVQETASIVH